MKGVKILSTGYYLPEKILTNADLEKMVDTSDEWITTRTGIKERHIAADGEAVSDMAEKAASQAVERAGISKNDIGLIITATFTPDYPLPSASCLIGEKMGIKNVQMFDISAACTGFIYALSVAQSMIKAGISKTALVIAAEKLTAYTDWADRGSCILFSDGAGAVVLSESDEDSFLGFDFGADGSFRKLLYVPAGGSLNPPTAETVKNRQHFIKMEGNKTFKVAVSRMNSTAKKALDKAGVSAEDIELLIPHQANIRIIEALARALKFSMEKVFVNIDKVGNCSAATIPVALAQADQAGRLKRGDLMELVAFGGGFTWGAAVIRY
ncbi:MAG: ketoacyl-ACP synthase III [Elusimicrobia bacterium]|nr:ketoacyl-ACP synthase III [Elusimicrobiota bacterium]